MYSRTSAVIFLSLATLLLSRVTEARPNPSSQCPTNVGRQALTRIFYYIVFDQPETARNKDDDLATFFSSNLTVIDNTSDYPSPIKGIKYPKRGTLAKSAKQFDIIEDTHLVWPYYGILGGYKGGYEHDEPVTDGSNGYVDLIGNNISGNTVRPCYVDSGVIITAKLLKDYGGKKKGDVVQLSATGHLELIDNPSPEDTTQIITKATYTVDWSNWYASLK